ncbi:MAG: hypothetical protein JO057_01670 [Chloroflexi bacterium]|nr:hypothetical protein [Chloroflexota bacterium]
MSLCVVYVLFATGGTWEFHFTSYTGYFDALGGALLRGQLYLPQVPSADFLALPNPYDPLQRAKLSSGFIADGSFYRNHFYLYWGPVPALLHAGWHLVTDDPLHDGQVEVAGALASTLAFWLLLTRVRRRAFPVSARGLVWACVAAFAVGGTLPYLLARPSVYHEPLVLATALLMGCLLCMTMVAIDHAAPRRVFMLLGGCLLGLAIATRITYAAYAPGLLILVVWLGIRGARPYLAVSKNLIAFGGPLLCAGLALMLYNWARFDSPLEFGLKYQLTSFLPAGQTCGRDLSGYFEMFWLSVPRLDVAFPFLPFSAGPLFWFAAGSPTLVPPETAIHGPIEPPILSVLLLAPSVLLAVSAPWLYRGRAAAGLGVLVVSLLIGLLLNTGLLSCAGGVDARYVSDLVPASAVVGGVLALTWSDQLARAHTSAAGRWRRCLHAFVAVATAVSILSGLALGMAAWMYWSPTPSAANQARAWSNAVAEAVLTKVRPESIPTVVRSDTVVGWRADADTRNQYLTSAQILLRSPARAPSAVLLLNAWVSSTTPLSADVDGRVVDLGQLRTGVQEITIGPLQEAGPGSIVSIRLDVPQEKAIPFGWPAPIVVQEAWLTPALRPSAIRTVSDLQAEYAALTKADATPELEDEVRRERDETAFPY